MSHLKEKAIKQLTGYLQSERNLGITILLNIFLMGINYMHLVIPEAVLSLITSFSLIIGIIGYFSFTYWTFYFWNQYEWYNRLKRIIMGTLYSLMLMVCGFIIFRIAINYWDT